MCPVCTYIQKTAPFPRRRESSSVDFEGKGHWVPAFTGMENEFLEVPISYRFM